MTGAPALSPDCLGWARTAGFVHRRDDEAGIVELRSEVGAPIRYVIRRPAVGRVELVEVDELGDERLVLFVAEMKVLERFLFGVFGDDIRAEVDLPFVELPWDRESLATGYEPDDTNPAYQILTASGRGPVAAVPRSEVGLLALVPLSHFLGWSLAALKRSFLDENFRPLLSPDGSYAQPDLPKST
ncbi:MULTISPECIES: Imm61 family immunity protein [Mycobacteriaceae]|uniref:Imm61 family immunity protein n=1 Tax=Mycolicibacterium goodii TaxID=134601 RepID=UPI001BDC0C60|nr:Imm61 family immunity protein [Mycolicibacterium goodii]MBU8813182.1 TNT antitoxin family protein [Mycolicibacterium goodii]